MGETFFASLCIKVQTVEFFFFFRQALIFCSGSGFLSAKHEKFFVMGKLQSMGSQHGLLLYQQRSFAVVWEL